MDAENTSPDLTTLLRNEYAPLLMRIAYEGKVPLSVAGKVARGQMDAKLHNAVNPSNNSSLYLFL